MRISIKSAVLIAAQLACIAYLLVSDPWRAHLHWAWLEAAGLCLGAWAVFTIKLQNVRIAPEVGRGGRLVTHGPYRFIRHPMYAAVLLVTLAWLLDRFTGARLVAWLVLAGDLLIKLEYEEQLLGKRFSEYPAYRARTNRLVPFVY